MEVKSRSFCAGYGCQNFFEYWGTIDIEQPPPDYYNANPDPQLTISGPHYTDTGPGWVDGYCPSCAEKQPKNKRKK